MPPRSAATAARMALGMDKDSAQRSQVTERIVEHTELDDKAIEAEEAAAEGRAVRKAPGPLTEDVTREEDIAAAWRMPKEQFDAAADRGEIFSDSGKRPRAVDGMD